MSDRALVSRAVRVKICGLARREDVLAADRLGADYLGFVLSSGYARSVAPRAAADLASGTTARKVAVLVDESVDGAEALARELGADVIQLHGDEAPELLAELHRRGPWTLWKGVRARTVDDLDRALARHAQVADGILVEGWRAGVPGGGGARLGIDPDEVRARMPTELDFVLAGGLDGDTVGAAVAGFGPEVVDVSSGVERTVGAKDLELLERFIRAARAAGAGAAHAVGPKAGSGA